MAGLIIMALAVLAAWASAAATTQEAPAVAVSSSRQYDLRSSVTARNYRLFVALPERYDTGTARYPVL